jgi:hypothetical protein
MNARECLAFWVPWQIFSVVATFFDAIVAWQTYLMGVVTALVAVANRSGVLMSWLRVQYSGLKANLWRYEFSYFGRGHKVFSNINRLPDRMPVRMPDLNT